MIAMIWLISYTDINNKFDILKNNTKYSIYSLRSIKKEIYDHLNEKKKINLPR